MLALFQEVLCVGLLLEFAESRGAERMGFEPMIRFWRIHTFQACAIDQLGHLSNFVSSFARTKPCPERVSKVQFNSRKLCLATIYLY